MQAAQHLGGGDESVPELAEPHQQQAQHPDGGSSGRHDRVRGGERPPAELDTDLMARDRMSRLQHRGLRTPAEYCTPTRLSGKRWHLSGIWRQGPGQRLEKGQD